MEVRCAGGSGQGGCLRIVEKGNQCLISSIHHTLTSILSSTSIRFSSVLHTKQTTRVKHKQSQLKLKIRASFPQNEVAIQPFLTSN